MDSGSWFLLGILVGIAITLGLGALAGGTPVEWEDERCD